MTNGNVGGLAASSVIGITEHPSMKRVPSSLHAQLIATTGYKDFNGNQAAGSHINWPAAAATDAHSHLNARLRRRLGPAIRANSLGD